MASVLWIDTLGKRYGMLPSEVIGRANTFDLYIMDMALTFENYHHKKSMNGGKNPIPDYTTDELLEMVAKGKEDFGDSI
jgi:hypothetical protein